MADCLTVASAEVENLELILMLVDFEFLSA